MNLRPWLSSCNQGGAQLIFFLALALVTLLALSPTPPPETLLLGDKVNHVLAFVVLALLADLGWPSTPYLLHKALPLLGYGVAIEVIQHFIPTRSFSGYDVLADAGGLAIYLTLVPLRRRVLPGATVGSCRPANLDKHMETEQSKLRQ